MGSFAYISMQVDLSRRSSAADAALESVETFAGTKNVALDAATGTLTFEMLFPGNVSALVGRLRSNLIPVADSAKVVVPVRSFGPQETVDPDVLRRALEDGPEIWDVEFARGRYVLDARFEGDAVEASIVPSSYAMHQLYDTLLHLGIAAEGNLQPAQSV